MNDILFYILMNNFKKQFNKLCVLFYDYIYHKYVTMKQNVQEYTTKKQVIAMSNNKPIDFTHCNSMFHLFKFCREIKGKILNEDLLTMQLICKQLKKYYKYMMHNNDIINSPIYYNRYRYL